jgi:hypothetical protein
MANLKHVGRMVNNKRKIVVAYRVVPDEPDHSIVVATQNLSADEHDSLMKLVESSAGQSAHELADIMARTRLPDGRVMLAAFHKTGKLIKVKSDTVEMTPNRNSTILLSELNQLIADQHGVTVADLAVKPKNAKETTKAAAEPIQELAKTDGVLSDEDLAAQYRSQADSLFKEAKRLREQAEELAPTKKKATTKTEESA